MFKKLLLVGLMSLLLGVLIFIFVGEKPAASQEEFSPLVEGKYVPNQVLVKFREGTNLNSIQGAIISVKGEIIPNLEDRTISLSQWDPEDVSQRSFRLDPNLFHLKVPIGTEQAIRILNSFSIVEYVEENRIETEYECAEPNDPEFLHKCN